MRAAILLLIALALAGAAHAAQPWRGDWFPNAVLLDQEGRKHRFYDDVIKGKTVALSFIYTKCTDVCPADTAQLMRVRDLLKGRVGKDIHFYSISIDPARDTPEVLKAYMHMFGIDPAGWTFLTGKQADIDLIRRKLGMLGARAETLRQHDTSLIVGNEPSGQWIRRSPYDDPKILAILLGESLGNTAHAETRAPYSAAPQFEGTSAGAYVFRTRCASCHTVGGGDRLGPDLAGVVSQRDRSWLIRWIREPDVMIAEGDPLALALKARYRNLPMPNLGLSDKDARAVLEYLEKPQSSAAATPRGKP